MSLQFDERIFPDIVNAIAKFSWNLIVQDLLLINKKMWSLRDQIFLYDHAFIFNTKINPRVKNRLKSVETTFDKIPRYAEKLVIIGDFCEIKKGDLPMGLKYLSVSATSIEEDAIPSTVEELFLTIKKPDVIKNRIPPVKCLHVKLVGPFKCYKGGLPEFTTFNSSLVPNSVETLCIDLFQTIKGKLPSSIKSLILSTTETCTKEIIPENLEKISFRYFEDDVYFPETVREIEFDECFNRSLKDKIPDSVTSLILPNAYKKPLGTLPSRLEKLVLGPFYRHPIASGLPNTLIHLELDESFDEDLICPPLLKHLSLKNSCYRKPKYEKMVDFSRCLGLKSVLLGNRFSNVQIPHGVTDLELHFGIVPTSSIPSSVISLIISCDTVIPKGFIPSSVRTLKFEDGFNQPIQGVIPWGVKSVTFGDDFNRKIGRCIPPTVTHLDFGNGFNQPINYLPKSITHLSLGYDYNRHCVIPDNVIHLKIFPLGNVVLPKYLQVLKLKATPVSTFVYPKEEIPKTLTELYLSEYEDYYQIPWVKNVRLLRQWTQEGWD